MILKTETLKEKGLTQEQIDYVMAEVGKEINSLTAERDAYKSQLDTAQAYLKAMDNYPINILAHLNHIVKVDIEKIAKKAKENNVLIELNEKNLHFSEKEWEILIASGVKLVINSDAHNPEDIASFKNVEKFLQNKNIPDNRIINLKNIN